MDKSLQKTLTKAVALILRPIIRLWMKKGFSFRAFEEVIRWVFVSVAEEDFKIQAKKQTDSRISVITGLTRHQVNHYRSINLEESPEGAKSNRSTRVMTGWLNDKLFLDENGEPSLLKITTGNTSFQNLVHKYGGDISHKAVLDDLLTCGNIEKTKDERVKLISKGYIPKANENALIEIIGHDAASLIGTLEHNLNSEGKGTFFQKKVCYDSVPEEFINAFKKLSAEQAQKLLESLNEELGKSAVSEKEEDKNYYEIGMGVYYFQKEDT
ncbi:MAG: hypothetical protein HQL32_10245 [Planctomycetes bacterium]|nr:hypothetical protein [Planctomycetota bacterium]